jgi:hypothetical protein
MNAENKMWKIKDTRYLCGILSQASSRPKVRDSSVKTSKKVYYLYFMVYIYFIYLSMSILSEFWFNDQTKYYV